MDFRIIINSLLIIILLHLLLKNINYGKIITFYRENFNNNSQNHLENKKDDEENKNKDESLDFLLDLKGEYKQMETYVNKCNNIDIKAGNYYVEDENTSNFKSNVLNINDFYKTNKSLIGTYDNLDQNQLQNLQTVLRSETKKLLDPENNPYDKFNKYNMNNNNQWKYNNDLTMNGNKIYDNVYGYDNFETNYTTYNNNIIYNHPKNNSNSLFQDDERMGLGYPNRDNRNNS
jgi:hypothetical protein